MASATRIQASLIGAALAVLPLAACDRAPTAPLAVPAPSWIATAPTSVVDGGATLRLEAVPYRDFMPMSPTDGSPLAVVLRLRTASGAPLPSGLAIESAWVVYRGLAWTSQPEPTGAPWGPDVLEFVSRGGPRWGPDVAVDVVARVTGLTGGPRPIAARQVIVERTD